MTDGDSPKDERKRSKSRNPRPYVMRGAARVTEDRPTVLDPPDARVRAPWIPPLSAEAIRLVAREAATDPRLRAVDRCFQRWGVTPSADAGGPRLSSIVLINRSDGGPVPLDDVESQIVNAAVRSSPRWSRVFVQLWYRTDMTVSDIAKELCIKRREYVYHERHIVLSYFYGRLSEAIVQLPGLSETPEA